jgi:predicted secreted Zn-dependent protease
MSFRILPAGEIVPGVSHTFEEETLEEVAAAVEALPEAGKADFEFHLDYAYAGSRLTQVDLTMVLTLAMPGWTHVSRRPREEREEWQRFLRALRAHEDGHFEIFRREGAVAYERIRSARAGRINDVRAAEERRIDGLSHAYDLRTDHGLSQKTPHGTTVIQVPS